MSCICNEKCSKPKILLAFLSKLLSFSFILYNLWQYRLRQSSFYMHLVVIYHLLIHFPHPPSPHPFQCWRLATRHQVFVDPTLNWGNGGRYSFQIIWNYSSCPMVSGKDCSIPKVVGSIPTVVRLTFKPARCGYTLRVTSKTIYILFENSKLSILQVEMCGDFSEIYICKTFYSWQTQEIVIFKFCRQEEKYIF
jgi:hypothetical protein